MLIVAHLITKYGDIKYKLIYHHCNVISLMYNHKQIYMLTSASEN